MLTCKRTPVCQARPCRRSLVVASAAPSAKRAVPSEVVDSCVAKLKSAAKQPGSVPPAQLLQAVLTLEKAKLKPTGDEWLKAVAGRSWRLIWTAGSKDVLALSKGTPKGSGSYVPITAANFVDESEMTFENGVFFGNVAHLTFKGPFGILPQQPTRGMFGVNTMYLGLGPWRLPISLGKTPAVADVPAQQRNKLPFFLYAYIDEDMVVARGRSGGVALWGRAPTDWAAKAGVLQVYGK